MRRYSPDFMFLNAAAFDANITSWATAEGLDSVGMFSGATAWLHKYVCATDVAGNEFDGPPGAWA